LLIIADDLVSNSSGKSMTANKKKAIEKPFDRRAVWRLVKPYWISEERWKAWGLLAVIIALVLVMVYINVLLTDWNRTMYDSLQNKDYTAFKGLLWQFSYLAFAYIVVATARIYLTQSLQIRWRTWMTDKYMGKWLDHHAYYRMEQGRIADNPDQRIAEDLRSLTSNTISLVLGFISSLVTLVSFVGILWVISGPLSFAFMQHDWVIPGYMVWFAIAYAGVGSWIIWWIGKPLVVQSYDQERFEANYRFGLIRIREHAEAIALYRGERRERDELNLRFEDIRRNWWDIMRTTKSLNIASNFYGQFAVIFPMLVAAPRYFSGAMSLGVLMQLSSAFGQVQDALSWFINAFTTLADWKASINRLAGFNLAVEQAQKQPASISVARNNVGAILLDKLDLALPDGRTLIGDVNTAIHPGERILVSGPSGCGKSTLFRAIAGIWPYGAGDIQIPHKAKLMFVPQSSYLPIGTLRSVLAYPADDGAYTDLAISHYLELCRLPHLKDQLDVYNNWGNRLSPGEQQRLAFARVFLTRPEVIFLDEASSAMDGETEEALYALLQQELPDAAVVSIAHRETVARYHQQRWHFSNRNNAAGDSVSRLSVQPL
jgi:putative ATP-binding cassette transporter